MRCDTEFNQFLPKDIWVFLSLLSQKRLPRACVPWAGVKGNPHVQGSRRPADGLSPLAVPRGVGAPTCVLLAGGA